jgi:hypothetical protein
MKCNQSSGVTLRRALASKISSRNSVGAEIGKPEALQTASVGVSTTQFVRNEGAVIHEPRPALPDRGRPSRPCWSLAERPELRPADPDAARPPDVKVVVLPFWRHRRSLPKIRRPELETRRLLRFAREHSLGKGEVVSSILTGSTMKSNT